MLDAVDKAGVIHMVAFNYRRTPAVQFAPATDDEGSIGEVRNFRGTYLQDWSADPNGRFPGASRSPSPVRRFPG